MMVQSHDLAIVYLHGQNLVRRSSGCWAGLPIHSASIGPYNGYIFYHHSFMRSGAFGVYSHPGPVPLSTYALVSSSKE